MDNIALAERCETERPSRELDVEIEMATTLGLYHRTGDPDLPLRLRDDHYFAPPPYSTMIDAAVRHLPKGVDCPVKVTDGALAVWAAVFRHRARRAEQ